MTGMMARREVVRRLCGAALLVAAVLAIRYANFFAQELIAEAAILGLFALSLDFLAITGLISFGHAGLLGVGAYVYGGLALVLGYPASFAIVGAVVGGALTAFLVGTLAVRTSGAFFIMVTLAAAEMFFAWAFRNETFNRGDGLGGVPRLDLSAIGIDLNDPTIFAICTVALCTVAWIALEVVVASPFGRVLAAIRQNALRVTALGGRVFAYRLAAFTVSGAIAALAGAMKVQHMNFLSPELASWFVSGDVLIAVVIGGIGTLVGGVLGATLLVLLKNFLSGVFGYWYLFLGAIFIVVAIVNPRGLLGALLARVDRLQGRWSEKTGTR